MELKNLKHIHLVGIKGVGMTALAFCLQDLGIKVTGSDTKEIFVTDEMLQKRNLSWKEGFKKENLEPKPDLVITTGAHGGLNNPEVLAAKEMNIPVITHAEALAEISKGKDLIAVCGVGGKTTVSSMIATILSLANKNPSFAIGVGNIYPLNTSGKYDLSGTEFVAEADEFAISPGINNNPRFSLLNPKIIVVTNIEHDHPDIYPTLEDTKNTFRKFFEKIPENGLLVACLDNSNVASVIKDLKVPIQTYGFSEEADWQIKDVKFGNQSISFKLKNKERITSEIKLTIPGEYNILNATASFIVNNFLNLSEEEIILGIEKFKGCQRRFEVVYEIKDKNIVFVDDYAHHPSEIKAVLSATKKWFPQRRIISIFQPHTYSRTKAFFKEFAQAFSDADLVGIMDIYSSAREEKDESVSSEKLSEEIRKFKPEVSYTRDHSKTLEWLKENLKEGDVILTLGAGDIFYLYEKIKNEIR